MRFLSNLLNRCIHGRSRGLSPQFCVDPQHLTTSMPKVLWIELTSKCPYDCIFCTRKARFGDGRHLDFDLYRSVIGELESPEFIGLNYSGESLFYPHLIDAIRLANATGASTELVTAFSAISVDLLRDIIASGLDRLAVSLHTMDDRQYEAIYRYGSLALLKARVDDFFRIRQELGVEQPRLDFCFVAFHENLDQLVEVMRYARQVGASEIFVHPVIGRFENADQFSIELAANRLRGPFREALRKAIATSRAEVPEVPLTVLNPDVDSDPQLGSAPAYYAPPLPSNARIHTCDQSPFESVHIMSNGDVVVCEVHDDAPIGNLNGFPSCRRIIRLARTCQTSSLVIYRSASGFFFSRCAESPSCAFIGTNS